MSCANCGEKLRRCVCRRDRDLVRIHMRLVAFDGTGAQSQTSLLLDISEPTPADVDAALSASDDIPAGRVFELSGGPAGTLTARCHGSEGAAPFEQSFFFTIRGIVVAESWPRRRIRNMFLSTLIDAGDAFSGPPANSERCAPNSVPTLSRHRWWKFWR
jgi:hypothetical protein